MRPCAQPSLALVKKIEEKSLPPSSRSRARLQVLPPSAVLRMVLFLPAAQPVLTSMKYTEFNRSVAPLL